MFWLLAICSALVERAVSQSFPWSSPEIISYETQNSDDGYQFKYALNDGTVRSEMGSFQDGVWVVFWNAEWTDASGSVVTMRQGPEGLSWSIKGPGIYGMAGQDNIYFRPQAPKVSYSSPAYSSDVSSHGYQNNIYYKGGDGKRPFKFEDIYVLTGCKDDPKKKNVLMCITKAAIAGSFSIPPGYLERLKKQHKSA